MEDVLASISDGLSPEETIEKILHLPGEEQRRLVGRIGGLRSEKAAQFLTRLFPRATDRGLQKLIKKEIFLLKTQGVAVEEIRATGESVLKRTETTRDAEAFLSNFEADQAKTVVTAVEIKTNQFLFSHAAIHFTRGLIELRSFPIRRNELGQLLNEYVSRVQRPTVLQAISPPYAGFLIEEGAANSGHERDEARALNRLLSETKGDVRRPSDIYLLHVDQDVTSAPVETILSDDLFSPFLMQWDGMEEDRKKMNEVVNPSIVLPPYVIQERREGFLNDLSSSERVSAKLAPFKRMLEDFACLFYSLKQFGHYKGLVELLKDQSLIKKALLHFIQRTLDEKEKKTQQLPGVLVDPYDLMKR